MAGSVEVGRGHVTISTEESQLTRGLANARRKVDGFLSNLGQGIAQGIGQALAQGIGNLIRAGISEIGKATTAASNLNESLNKISVAFGDSSKDILQWSRTSATAFGQSQQQALEAASSFGLLFTTMGVARGESAEMSKALVELASDMASINNISPEEALIKLRAGLVGEIEPLRTVGVLLNAAAVEAKALDLGLAGSAAAITEQDKVMARYQLILEQTTLTQGDFARTSDELANSQRILAAQLEDNRARLGQIFLPIQLAFTRGMSQLITQMTPFGENIIDSLAAGMARGIIALLPVLQQIRSLFVYWLKPGSPPRLLRELTDWGRSAMEEYLRGWTQADFGALQSLGGTIENVLRSFVGSGALQETDLVSRIFGSQRAIVAAIEEFRNLGSISQITLDNIARAAGPAGGAIAGLVSEYFELQRATQGVSDAQNDLNDVTQKYADALNPLNAQLDAVRARQQEIRENQELEELGDVLRDPRADADERQLARLKIEEIQLERQARAIEAERDTALDAAQKKLDAAKDEESAAKLKFDAAQAALEQQVKTNSLVAEESNLRKRLADEDIAAQAQALRDLEAEQRKLEAADKARLAELERIYQAQLNFNLASTDTEGQLALMRAELGRFTVGSAEYYNILTQIVGLEERLKKEREAAVGGAGIFGPLADAVGDGGIVQEASEGIQALSAALDEAFAALSGEGGTPELNPFWQSVADNIGDIGTAVSGVVPIVKDFIGLFTGESPDVPTADILRPTGAGGGGFFSSIVPGIRGLISTLTLIRDGDWSALWNGFKSYVTGVLNRTGENDDPRTYHLYTWIDDRLIPALEDLAEGDWAKAWQLFADLAKAPFIALDEFLKERGFGQEGPVGLAPDPNAPAFKPPEDSPLSPNFWKTMKDNLEAYLEAMRQALREGLFGPDALQPQSGTGGGFSFNNVPSIAPQSPALAASTSTITNGATVVNNVQVNQQIATNGDFGGARQGAQEGIRQALLGRITT